MSEIPAPAAGENLYGWTDENRVGVNLYKWTETTPTTQLYAWTIQSGQFAYEDGNSSKPVTTIYTTTPNPSMSGSSYSELFDEYGNSYGSTHGSIMSWTLYDGTREMGETYVNTMDSSAITMIASGPV